MVKHAQIKSIDDFLKDLQNTEDAYLRKVAVEQLGEQTSSNDAVIKTLKNIAESDLNKYVRDAANNALMKMGIENAASEENLSTIAAENRSKKWAQTGFLAGLIPSFILIFLFPKGSLLLFFFGYLIGIPGALIGAYIGRRGNETTTWIGAIIGGIIGLALFIWFAIATCLICQ